jgi:hypothetical protein
MTKPQLRERARLMALATHWKSIGIQAQHSLETATRAMAAIDAALSDLSNFPDRRGEYVAPSPIRVLDRPQKPLPDAAYDYDDCHRPSPNRKNTASVL